MDDDEGGDFDDAEERFDRDAGAIGNGEDAVNQAGALNIQAQPVSDDEGEEDDGEDAYLAQQMADLEQAEMEEAIRRSQMEQ